MLTKRENDIMRAVYELTHETGICVVSPAELLANLPQKKKYNEEQIDRILQELALDDYFQLLSSERKGEKMYVISLHPYGYAYKRFMIRQRRNTLLKFAWAIASAVIAFLVGLLLKRIF